MHKQPFEQPFEQPKEITDEQIRQFEALFTKFENWEIIEIWPEEDTTTFWSYIKDWIQYIKAKNKRVMDTTRCYNPQDRTITRSYPTREGDRTTKILTQEEFQEDIAWFQEYFPNRTQQIAQAIN